MDTIKSELTAKKKRFCEEYIIDFNGTQAAIRSGYSKKTANEQASRLLTNVNIQSYIKILQNKLSENTQITAEMVINELAKIGFSDMREYYESEDKTKDITKMDNKLSAAISSIKITETEGEWGSRTIREFRLHDKLSALDKLGRHLGVFEKDNSQKKPELISPEILSDIVNKINNNAAS